jgi:hypothetical protein
MLANSEIYITLSLEPDFAIFKQRMPALSCRPDMRTCADVLKRMHTNKNNNERKRGVSVS